MNEDTHPPGDRVGGALTALIQKDWLFKESITLLGSSGKANVIVRSEPVNSDVDTSSYAESQRQAISKNFYRYEEFTYENMSLNGRYDGFVQVFEWTPDNGERVRQMQFYYVNNSRGYTATATARKQDYEEQEMELVAIINTLSFGPNPNIPHDSS